MSVPINAHTYAPLRKAPKYRKRANFRARRWGFQSALHMFLFKQMLSAKIKEKVDAMQTR
jgi:hypothetical protein